MTLEEERMEEEEPVTMEPSEGRVEIGKDIPEETEKEKTEDTSNPQVK